MKKIILIFCLFAAMSCTNHDPKEQLENINGYWQIEKVVIEEDSVIEFGLSQYIDYIVVKDSVGFRKKLKPKIDGGFIKASNDSENIATKIEGDKLILQYSTPFDRWSEEVVKATSEHLVILNRDHKTYYYQRYKPLLSQDEEETQE